MAGLGRKVFNAGEVLSAANVQGYLQDQVVQVYSGTAARSSALGTAVSEGMTSYLTDSNELSVYTSNGTAAWSPVNLSQSPNAIINGGFDIWQRGTSTTSSGFLADRWSYDTAGGDTRTQSRQTFTPGTAPVAGYESEFFYRVAITVASGYQQFATKIEDVRTFAGQTVTLSYWAKAAAAGEIIGSVYLDQVFGSGGSSAVNNTLTSNHVVFTTSWVRYSHTIALPSISGKTVGSGSSLNVRFTVDGTGTLDPWGVQLEAGSVATPFKRNASSLQGELAACQRYYFQVSAGNLAMIAPIAYTYNSSAAIGSLPFPVEMRTTPSSIVYSGLSFTRYDDTAYSVSSATIQATVTTRYAGHIVAVISGASTGNVGRIAGTSSTSYLGFSAEL